MYLLHFDISGFSLGGCVKGACMWADLLSPHVLSEMCYLFTLHGGSAISPCISDLHYIFPIVKVDLLSFCMAWHCALCGSAISPCICEPRSIFPIIRADLLSFACISTFAPAMDMHVCQHCCKTFGYKRSWAVHVRAEHSPHISSWLKHRCVKCGSKQFSTEGDTPQG